MMHVKYTYVDSITGVPVTVAPAVNGPAMPDVPGLEFAWARESAYPTDTPEFFGTCPGDSDAGAPGMLATLSAAEFAGALEREMEARRAALTQANNAGYEAAISAVTSDYPAAEIQTWERQRAEALAWAEDPTADTPWIDIAATARGLDRGEYLVRTLAKVEAFAQASAWLTGRRQGIDDAIRAATSLDGLQAVAIDYTLPGAAE